MTATTERRFRSRGCFADPSHSNMLVLAFERPADRGPRLGERSPGHPVASTVHIRQPAGRRRHLDFAVAPRRIAERTPRHNY